MSESKNYERITPPHTIANKVTKDGPPVAELLRKAEDAVNRLHKDYTNWVREDLAKLDVALKALREDPDRRRVHLDSLFGTAHDMKGEGGTFGYPLITRIGGSLCRYLNDTTPGDHDLKVLAAHIDAMKAVITNEVSGDGGTVGRDFATELEAVVDRTAG